MGMGAHRYWRINCTATNGSGQYRIQDVEMRTSAGGSDQCTGGTASASQVVFGSSVAGGFDDDGTTYWGAIGATHWLQYDFGAGNAKDIVELALVANVDVSTAPKNFTVQWSDDGSTFTTLMTMANITGWSPGQRRLFSASGETPDTSIAAAARYWRVVATALQSGSTVFALAEIELRATRGGADQTGSGTAASGTEISTGNVASNAVDKNPATKWETGLLPGWWYYDFGSGIAKDIQEVAIMASNQPNLSPTDFLIQRSDDSVRWATSMALSGISGWISGQTRYFNSTGETSGAPATHRRPQVFVCT